MEGYEEKGLREDVFGVKGNGQGEGRSFSPPPLSQH